MSADAELDNILSNSFLARVPALVAEGRDMDEAIALAMAQEEKLIGEMYAGDSTRSKRARIALAASLSIKVNASETVRMMRRDIDASY